MLNNSRLNIKERIQMLLRLRPRIEMGVGRPSASNPGDTRVSPPEQMGGQCPAQYKSLLFFSLYTQLGSTLQPLESTVSYSQSKYPFGHCFGHTEWDGHQSSLASLVLIIHSASGLQPLSSSYVGHKTSPSSSRQSFGQL